MSQTNCQSCGMPIDNGVYCAHCVGADGALQSFEERFERMIQWQARREPDASRADLEKKTLSYMGRMPAWKDHPRVKAAS